MCSESWETRTAARYLHAPPTDRSRWRIPSYFFIFFKLRVRVIHSSKSWIFEQKEGPEKYTNYFG